MEVWDEESEGVSFREREERKFDSSERRSRGK